MHDCVLDWCTIAQMANNPMEHYLDLSMFYLYPCSSDSYSYVIVTTRKIAFLELNKD